MMQQQQRFHLRWFHKTLVRFSSPQNISPRFENIRLGGDSLYISQVKNSFPNIETRPYLRNQPYDGEYILQAVTFIFSPTEILFLPYAFQASSALPLEGHAEEIACF